MDKVTLDYAGTAAATGAAYYSGLLDREQGNATEAKAHFETAMRGKGSEYPALARLALGGMLLTEGDAEAAREHFQQIVDNPTRTIPKDRASIEVATRSELGTCSLRFKPRTARPALWQQT